MTRKKSKSVSSRSIRKAGSSHSGLERNHFFLNKQGKFDDFSLISGVNHIGDSTSFSKCDYNRDGRQDIVLTNRNAPMLKIYTNNIEVANNHFFAVRFVGGNRSSFPSSTWSSRDAYGARIKVFLPEATLLRELRCGEGYGAQNSSTLIIGVGNNKVIPKIKVFWPSGKIHIWENIHAGSLVTFDERREKPSIEKYQKENSALKTKDLRPTFSLEKMKSRAKITLFITMATWCSVCKREIPYLQKIRREFAHEDIEIIGLPISKEGDYGKLNSYVKRFSPPYNIYFDITEKDKTNISQHLQTELHLANALPCHIIVNSSQKIIATDFGLPSISHLYKHLDEDAKNE